MWGWKINGLIWLCIFLGLIPEAKSQQVSWSELMFPSGNFGRKPKVSESIDYSLTCSGFFFSGWSHDRSHNNFLFLQNLRYNWSAESRRKIRISNQWVNDFGFQIFPDSISRVQPDENTFTTRLEVPVSQGFFFSMSGIFSSGFFNGYDYRTNDSGKTVRVLSSAFLTPLICNISGGFSWKSLSLGSFILGISAMKITVVRDKSVYAELQTEIYRGVPKDKTCLLEYGISLQFLTDRDLWKWMHWNCDFLLFKNQDSPWDINMKNQFAFRLTRNLKITLQTRILYEEQISRKLQIENVVSAGIGIKM